MHLENTIVFCDFDGTFAEKDIGHRLFTHFSGGRNQEIVKSWKRGEISSRKCLLSEAELISLTLDQLHSFLYQFGLRRGAEQFYREVTADGTPFYIVSDGNDLYLDFMLRKAGLNNIEFYCNHGRIDNGRLILEFPYDNDGCERCGTCKGARMKEILSHYEERPRVIFIGDGLSDICALPLADLVFARGDLLEYCRKHNQDAVEYADFFDILNYLNSNETGS